MTADVLNAIRDLIQEDVCGRGLRTDPVSNLVNAYPDDFAAACRSIADHPRPGIAVVTGFFIPTATPPAGETDGPLGALFLARALTPLGIRVGLLTDGFCQPALAAGLAACGLQQTVLLLTLPGPERPWDVFVERGWLPFVRQTFGVTHLIALERVGPSHTLASLQAQYCGAAGETLLDFLDEVPAEHHDRCHTMRGLDITDKMAPAHRLFEAVRGLSPAVTSIGIGDGGNELGMGKLRWDVIRRNVPGGGRVACRVPADHLIVCGISNWGAYGLAAGVRLLRGAAPGDLFDPQRERELLALMVERGPLVDGVTGRQSVSVDGLPFDRYAEPLRQMARLINAR
jgi:D-glutamate cyclase